MAASAHSGSAPEVNNSGLAPEPNHSGSAPRTPTSCSAARDTPSGISLEDKYTVVAGRIYLTGIRPWCACR